MTAELPSVEILQPAPTSEWNPPSAGHSLFYFYVDVAEIGEFTDAHDACIATSRINEPMSDLEEALRYADA